MAIMNVLPYSSESSSYTHRTVVIDVSGMDGERTGRTHTVVVPYSSLSQTLQGIHRLGGHVVKVAMPSLDVDAAIAQHHHQSVESVGAVSPTHVEPKAQVSAKPVAHKPSTRKPPTRSTQANQQPKRASKQRSNRKKKS